MFEPKTLNEFLTQHSVSGNFGHDVSLEVDGREKVEKLLHSALSDWVDFLFVPTPKTFVIYADHDEFTTCYANTKSNLNRVVIALTDSGFDKVDYVRKL